MIKLIGFIITVAIISFFYLPAQTATAQAGSIKINEFAAVTDGNSANPDWVELYNDSNSIVSLEGWLLRDLTETNKVSLTGCISPNSFRKFNFYRTRLGRCGLSR